MNVLNQETTEIENRKTLIKEIEREISETRGNINLLDVQFALLKKEYKENIKLSQQRKKELINMLNNLYKVHTETAYAIETL